MRLIYCFLLLCIPLTAVFAQQTSVETLRHQENNRLFRLYSPPGLGTDGSPPTVIVLHGGGGNAQATQFLTRMNPVADAHGFLVVYPQGLTPLATSDTGFAWADGRGTAADRAGTDDVGFVRALVTTLVADYGSDPDSVYVCGFSNGGFMTQRLAAEIPELFAAAGALGASLGTEQILDFADAPPLPIFYLAGTEDPAVPYAGGPMPNPGVTPIVAVDTAVAFWADVNDCRTQQPPVPLADVDRGDGSSVQVVSFTDCARGGEVLFYRIVGGSHTWPGGLSYQGLPVNRDISASEELWKFFSRFGGSEIPVSTHASLPLPVTRLYPNPARTFVNIDSDTPPRLITIFSSAGRRLRSATGSQVRTDDLPGGYYFCRLLFADGRIQLLPFVVSGR